MASIDDVDALNAALAEVDNLEESLQHIDWGLSEVAMVSAYSTGPDIGLLVAWEGTREIRVEAARVRFHTSPG